MLGDADLTEVSPRLEISLYQMSNHEVLYFKKKLILSAAISAKNSIIVGHMRCRDILSIHCFTVGYTIAILRRHESIVGRFWCSMYENDW